MNLAKSFGVVAAEPRPIPLINQIIGILVIIILIAILAGMLYFIYWMLRGPVSRKPTQAEIDADHERWRARRAEKLAAEERAEAKRATTTSKGKSTGKHCSKCGTAMRAKKQEPLPLYEPIGGWWRCTGCSQLYCDRCVSRHEFTRDDGDRDTSYSCPNQSCRRGNVEPVYVV